MPVYDYKCKEHGVFNELATIDNADQPCKCPQCGELSARVIMVSPAIQEMAKERLRAFETNERNSHEPTFSTKERREEDHEHKSGCGCSKKASKSKLMYTAQGDKMFPSMRPWMISH